ncbi:MAG TPA: DUF2280 domain-containing protein [Pyrinomonadaceae bacterium]|nr:DUF2280 domain-containing protein [Pyrinomonadaceae bacterium]
MAKNTLPEEIKRFIVRSLAVYETPSEVAASVKAVYNKKVTRQNVHFYDPTKLAGEGLSEELKTLFTETRRQFDETEIMPLSKKNVRIKKLSKYVEVLEDNDNLIGAAGILEQIAKEEGNLFTNRRELTGEGGGKIKLEHSTRVILPRSNDSNESTDV